MTKSHILFKPYLYFISIVGLAIAVWQLSTVPMRLDLPLVFFILFNTVAETIDYHYFDTRTSLTLGAANTFFIMMFYPFSAVVLTCIFAVLAQAYFRKKNGLWEKVINQKTVFNMAMYVMYNYITYLGLRLLGIVLPSNAIILGVFILFQNVLNGLLLCIVQSLSANKPMFYTIFKDMTVFYLSTLVMTLMLIYNYYYIGIWAVIGIYFIFAMAQSSMQLAVDNKMKAEKLYRDNLTGTFNREYFIKTIETKLKTKRQFSIIFLDLDEFKQINDEFGHLVGDRALQKFAEGMKGILRKEDLLYRYGGDEFAIVAADKETAEVIGRKLYENKIFMEHETGSIDIKFSTGIYNCKGSEESYELILTRVDAAMYAAKQKGGHQIVHVEPSVYSL